MPSRYLIPLLCLVSLSAQTVKVSTVMDTYCAGCHNGRMKSPSGALLEQFDTTQISANPEVWSRAYRQLQAGTMPPVGASRPDRATYDAVLTSLEQAMSANVHTKLAASSDSQEIATRLATLLWNSAPDAALLQDAKSNRLSDTITLERQIRRMLADDRAEAFVSRFFIPWLQLDKLGKADPDKNYFPDYDVSLRDALTKETSLFLLSQLREDRDPVELWSANYTFLNDQLARHYDIPNVTGPQFRRVVLSAPERGGLLGQGSVLMATSYLPQGVGADYTSPATRAKWVLGHFLGLAPPRPFPGAMPVKPELPITPQTRVLALNPCVTCHRNFFPLGYALENFDAIGRWRTKDQVGPVDASGALVDGTSTNGVVELRQGLLQRPDAFRTTITERLLAYESGKGNVSPETLIRGREILGTKKPCWSAVIAGIVTTKPSGQ